MSLLRKLLSHGLNFLSIYLPTYPPIYLSVYWDLDEDSDRVTRSFWCFGKPTNRADKAGRQLRMKLCGFSFISLLSSFLSYKREIKDHFYQERLDTKDLALVELAQWSLFLFHNKHPVLGKQWKRFKKTWNKNISIINLSYWDTTLEWESQSVGNLGKFG